LGQFDRPACLNALSFYYLDGFRLSGIRKLKETNPWPSFSHKVHTYLVATQSSFKATAILQISSPWQKKSELIQEPILLLTSDPTSDFTTMYNASVAVG
jgi:hypothetical protein